MANITKYIVSGRRQEPIAATAAALTPPAPWPISPDRRSGDRRGAADESADRRARFRQLLGRRPAGDGARSDRARITRSPLGPHGLQGLLGEVAWRRLPQTVRYRFSEPTRHVDYTGEFDIVRASLPGRAIAWISTLIGTPVV